MGRSPKRLSAVLCLTLALWGCASVLNEDEALAVAPYHIVRNGHIVIEGHVNGRGPFRFALDSGASISVVFDKLSEKLVLKPIPDQVVTVYGLIASGSFPLMDIDELSVGTEVWTRPRVASLPGDTVAKDHVDGILGVDFLGRYSIGFDTEDRVVRLYPPEVVGRRSYQNWTSIPLRTRRFGTGNAALYFFDIEFDNRTIPAVLDLGAGINMVNWAAARNLGITPTDPRYQQELSGTLESAPISARFKYDEVTTGDIVWRDEPFLVVDLDIFTMLGHGDTPFAVIGAGLLSQRDFIIDFARSRLLVKTVTD